MPYCYVLLFKYRSISIRFSYVDKYFGDIEMRNMDRSRVGVKSSVQHLFQLHIYYIINLPMTGIYESIIM